MKYIVTLLIISSLLFSCSVTSKGTNGKPGEDGKPGQLQPKKVKMEKMVMMEKIKTEQLE